MDLIKNYHYQFRRPRFNNPTFLSSNVSSSLSFYNNSKISPDRYKKQNSFQYKNNLKASQSDYSLPKINQKHQKMLNNPQNNQFYNNMNEQKSKLNYLQNQNSQTHHYPITSQNGNRINHYQRKNKLLSHSVSRNDGVINFNQKDIYKKQGHNYDIITYQPKTHNEHIKKYPKLSLQQKDQYFRLKYQNVDQFIKDLQKQQRKQINSNINSKDQKIAGMYTYRLNQNQKHNYLNKRKQSNNKINDQKGFNMKMLNHIDELNAFS